MPDEYQIDWGGREGTGSAREGLAAAVAGFIEHPTRTLRQPVFWFIVVMVLAGIFGLLSGDPVDRSVLLFVAAAALVWDRGRRQRSMGAPTPGSDAVPTTSAPVVPPSPGIRFPPWASDLAIVYAWVVGSFARFTWPITVSVAIPGLIAIWLAWHDRPEERPGPPEITRATAIAWASVFVSVGVLELVTFLMQPAMNVNSDAHPTISYLLDPLLNQHHLARSVALCVWLGFGWYLTER